MGKLIFLLLLVVTAGLMVFYFEHETPLPPKPAALSEQSLSVLPKERKGQVLIYGAYGYTGTRIAELASEYGLQPVLAGRNPKKLKALADRLGLASVALTLENNHENLVKVLKRFELVLHIAGPYTYTSKPMIDAAIEARTHYLDLSGEIHVLQALLARDQEFRQAGIMVLPASGVGALSDCLNLYVAQKIDKPSKIVTVLNTNVNQVEGARITRGTAKSGLEILGRARLARQGGELVEIGTPKRLTRELRGAEQSLILTSWADIVSSHLSTGVATIETYSPIDRRVPSVVLWLAQYQLGRQLLSWYIDHYLPEGPPEEAAQARRGEIDATASNEAGESASAVLSVPEAYLLTAHTVLTITKRILAGELAPGYQTPAKVFGPDLVLDIPGVTRQDAS